MLVLVVFAFVAGLVTILSPCILPVLPVVLSSSVAGGRKRPLGVIVGLVFSFAFFTLVVSQVVIALNLPATALRVAAVVALAVLGIATAVPALNARMEAWLSRLSGGAAGQPARRADWWGGLLTGASLGAVWTPCVGSIVAAVISLTASRQVTWDAAALVVAYAVGVGVPLLAVAYGGRAVMARTRLLSRHLGRVQQGFGVVMVATAALIALNVDVAVTAWATQSLPEGWTARLSRIEEAEEVRGALDRLTGVESLPGVEGDPGEGIAALPAIGPAPEIVGIDHWLNGEPLTIGGLRGRVVLVDFWTYSCINCIRTLPYLTAWHDKYADDGLVIIGVHSPEFAFERETVNVQDAIERFGIRYPVAQDNGFQTWRAFGNRYWPAKYLIDAEGYLRYVHYGEGAYEESERVIRALLAEIGASPEEDLEDDRLPPIARFQTPELYIGTLRQTHFAAPDQVVPGEPSLYYLPEAVPLHEFAVEGRWRFEDEYAQVETAGARLRLHFTARDVYLVMDAPEPTAVRVELILAGAENRSPDLDGEGRVTVEGARLYHLVSLDAVQEGAVDVVFLGRGVRAYAFTFGG